MPANSVTTFLKYANLQMAAEALLDDPEPYVTQLTSGNNRSSRFTNVLAEQFIANGQGWVAVAHQANTPTGFSGTLFRYNGATDAARGLTNGELVLSFRSTEFADDAARDNEATNVGEIKPFGWAFGQLADMMNWYDALVANGTLAPADRFAVTGYSLGGHLAAAFNQAMVDRGQAGRITATYTYNGAGVGTVNAGHTLNEVISSFNAQRTADHTSFFATAPARDLYVRWRGALNGDASVEVRGTALGEMTQAKIALSANPVANQAALAELDTLYEATARGSIVLREAVRVNAVIASGAPNSPAAQGVVPSQIEAIKLDYQLAVLQAKSNTAPFGSSITDGLGAAYATNREPRTLAGASPIFDVYGAPLPSAVANSQIHYGQPVSVFIENQPLYRGQFFARAAWQSLLFGEAKLLVDGFANNDFGDTHSLVLLVDSLSVQNLLATLDPTVDQTLLDTILHTASNLTQHEQIGSQGKAEGDVLENALDGLRRMLLGPSVTPTPANLDGGTWANIDDRNVFYNNLKALADHPRYTALIGNVRIGAAAADSGLAARARTDFTAMVTLLTLSPITLQVSNAAAGPAIEATLGNVWADAYAGWNADRALTAAQLADGAATYSDNYLADRAGMLLRLGQVNERNLEGTGPNARVFDLRDGYVATGTLRYEDRASATTVLYSSRVSSSLPTRFITFGSEGNDSGLSGNSADDRLYGGSGDDTLSGLAGADHLEGNTGADRLDGGEGTDTLLGGIGADSLDGGAGNDSVLGGDGADVLTGGTGNDVLNGGDGLDVYQLSQGWGHDIVQDSDGRGGIFVDGLGQLTGAGADKVADGVWQTADKRINYTLLSVDGTRNDLYITFSDRTDVITILRNWSAEKNSRRRRRGSALSHGSARSVRRERQGEARKVVAANSAIYRSVA